MGSLSRKIGLWGWPALLLGLSLLTACVSSPPQRELPEPVVPEDVEDPWRQDLALLERELPRLHYDLFHTLSPQEFQRRVRAIDEAAPGLSKTEFELELRKLLASVGDSHTTLAWEPEELFPVSFSRLEEGFIVLSAADVAIEALSMRLLAIDETPIEAVRERFAPIISHENGAQLADLFSQFVRSPRFLYHLGITRSDRVARFTFADYQGGTFTIPLEPVPVTRMPELVSLVDRIGYTRESAPLYLLNSEKRYWFEHAPERRLLYIAYNQCSEDPERPMDQFTGEIRRVLREGAVDRVVVDLRRNGGGDSRVLRPLVRLLAEAAENREIYVFIGAKTYSSAVLNAIELEQEAGAILVGSPTGGRPNHYGEVRELELPNLGATARYATKYFEIYEGEKGEQDAIFPDIEAPYSLAALIQKRDPAMEAIR